MIVLVWQKRIYRNVWGTASKFNCDYSSIWLIASLSCGERDRVQGDIEQTARISDRRSAMHRDWRKITSGEDLTPDLDDCWPASLMGGHQCAGWHSHWRLGWCRYQVDRSGMIVVDMSANINKTNLLLSTGTIWPWLDLVGQRRCSGR